MQEVAPAFMDRFHVRRGLVVGGMGETFLADDNYTRRRVVVKTMLPGVADRASLLRFEHEIDVLRAVQHPLVPAYVGDGFWNCRRAVALAFVEGVSLSDVMRLREPIEPTSAVLLMVDVLRTLQRVHGIADADGALRGVVHRDVTPRNILCDHRGRPHLIDFGISVDDWFDDSGLFAGTMGYVAPEQANGAHVDARADQFSVGIILRQLLTPDHDLVAGFGACSWEESDVATAVGVPLTDVLDRMVHPDRRRRYESCSDAADALVQTLTPRDEIVSMVPLVRRAIEANARGTARGSAASATVC